MKQKQKDPRKKRLIAVLGAWLAGIVIILIIFAVNSKRIFSIIDETQFVEHVFGGSPQQTASADTTASDTVQPQQHGSAESMVQPDVFPLTQTQSPPRPATAPAVPDTAGAEQPAAGEALAADAGTEAQDASEPAAPVYSDVKLYFVVVDSDGTVSRKETVRSLNTGNSPLTAAIEALLAGPTRAEADKGLQTLIPSGTRLRSAMVRDGIAILDFSDEFQYNRYGVEGYLGQLMQIVYTACAFSSVNSVQFIIEGQKLNYLGSEGVWIGTPLNAASF